MQTLPWDGMNFLLIHDERIDLNSVYAVGWSEKKLFLKFEGV